MKYFLDWTISGRSVHRVLSFDFQHPAFLSGNFDTHFVGTYLAWGSNNRGGNNTIGEWLQSTCVPVEQFSAQGGQPAGGPSDGPDGGGNTLYECGS